MEAADLALLHLKQRLVGFIFWLLWTLEAIYSSIFAITKALLYITANGRQ